MLIGTISVVVVATAVDVFIREDAQFGHYVLTDIGQVSVGTLAGLVVSIGNDKLILQGDGIREVETAVGYLFPVPVIG